jgi:hypothetical protein
MKKIILFLLTGILMACSALAVNETEHNDTTDTLQHYFNLSYGLNMYVHSSALNKDIYWSDNALADVDFLADKVRVNFEDSNDYDYNDLIVEIAAENDQIIFNKISSDTTSLDPTYLKLHFTEPHQVLVEETGEAYAGTDLNILVWIDNRYGMPKFFGGNERTFKISPAPTGDADIDVDAIILPDTIETGKEFAIKTTVYNRGSKGTYFTVYDILTKKNNAGYTYQNGKNYYLGSGQSIVIESKFTVTDAASWAYNIKAVADEDDYNGQNNWLSIEVPVKKADTSMPDLKATKAIYQNGKVYATVKNVGNAKANSFMSALYELDDEGDVEHTLGTQGPYSLGSAETKNFVFGPLNLSAGIHYLKFYADSGKNVNESNENNNWQLLNVTIDGAVNDSVDVKITPTTRNAQWGDVVEYTVTVTDGRDNELCINDCNDLHTYKLSLSGISFSYVLQDSVKLKPGEKIDVPLKITLPEQTTTIGDDKKKDKHDDEEDDDEGYTVKDSGKNEFVTYKIAVTAKLSTDSSINDVDYAALTVNGDSETPPMPPMPGEKITVTLKKGWNLVSIPGSFLSFVPGDCTSKKKLLGFVYVNDKKKYYTLQDAKDLLSSGFSAYLSENSFWIYSYEDCVLTVQVADDTSLNDITLAPGWNLKPVINEMVGKKISQIDGDCDLSNVYWFNANQQQWKLLSNDYVVTSSDIGKGFVIKSSKSCTFGNLNPPEMPA